MARELEWFADKLPKTRSGKIMRRLLKAQETGSPLGDTSTLEDWSPTPNNQDMHVAAQVVSLPRYQAIRPWTMYTGGVADRN